MDASLIKKVKHVKIVLLNVQFVTEKLNLTALNVLKASKIVIMEKDVRLIL